MHETDDKNKVSTVFLSSRNVIQIVFYIPKECVRKNDVDIRLVYDVNTKMYTYYDKKYFKK